MAAPVNKAKFMQDINAPIKAVYGGSLMFSKDNLSKVISVNIVDGGQPFDVTGTVSGTVIRSDGTTVPVDTGAISGNTVSLTLTEACFDVPGQIVVNIIVKNGDVKCCVLRAVYTVVPTETSEVVDPGDILPSIADLINNIDAAVASIPADYSGLLASIAGTFSQSTPYVAGSYVWYDGTLYRFTAAHAAGSWTGSDATAVTIGGELADIKSAFVDSVYPEYSLLAGKYISDVDGSYAQSSSGAFSATEHIAVNGAKTLIITATRASQYNAFYDSSDEFISTFTVQIGTNNIIVPSNAEYFALSNITANMQAEKVVLPSLTNVIKAAENAVLKMPSNGGLTDANNAEINRIYLLTDIANISNLPVAAQGTLITLARDASATTQLYINASKNIFYRACWGATWSNWKKILLEGEAVTQETYESGIIPFEVSDDGKYISEIDGTLQQSSSGAFQHTDFLPLNGLGKLIITTDRASIYNAVYDANKNFIMAFTLQVGKNIVTVPVNAAYFRMSNIEANLESTTVMLPVLTSAESITCNGNMLSAFSNIACCGDSLTWSMVYTGNSSFRQAYKPYPIILETETGADTEILAAAGYTPSSWWATYGNGIAQKTNQLAIIYLGTNSGLTDTLSTDAPTGTDPSTWAETQTGYYARIVAAWKAVGAKVLLVKCYATSGTGGSNLENTNKAIESIANRFECGLAENDYIADSAMHMWPNRQGQNTNHYNDLGYAEFTKQLISYVEFMDRRYLQYIIPD